MLLPLSTLLRVKAHRRSGRALLTHFVPLLFFNWRIQKRTSLWLLLRLRERRHRKNCYLVPMTIESGPIKCSTRVSRKPASFIHPEQSAPV